MKTHRFPCSRWSRCFPMLLLGVLLALSSTAEPLRIFIRGGKKSHGKNAHEHEQFLRDWKVLLTERGMVTDGAMDWPTAEQLQKTDVLVMYAQEGGNATDAQKANLAEFTRRGGGIVVIHTASVSNDPVWWKSVIGGAWVQGTTKWKEGPIDLYYTENQQIGGGHPITRGASNFHLDDEIYYDMDLSPDVRVLATSYTPKLRDGSLPGNGNRINIYDIQPQMWTYETTTPGGSRPYRAVVSLPGHLYDTFNMPHYRAILLRSIAWASNRENVDEFVTAAERDALTYPVGGPRRPVDSVKALEMHPDFTVSLIAAEPLINNPMNFDWDPAGRLWVAESPEYPNGRRGMRTDYLGRTWKDHGGIDPTPGEQQRPATDRISILKDTDGDGIMDSKTVFYDGLDLVTGLVFYKDGVIVTQAPEILFLRDTDGDGTCDKVERLYRGLGAGDTHALINNPRWGWDGWIYCTHGYSAGHATNDDGSKDFGNIGSGVVRFRPDGSGFEQYASKGGNTWGLEITGDNRVMWTQPTSGTLLNQVVLPESALVRGRFGRTPAFNTIIGSQRSYPAMAWEQMAYVQIDRVGDFTSAAGCVIYDGGAWPAEYNGDYFTTEPTINIITHQRLTPKASSYSAAKLPGREETEFVRSTDMWWRPIEVRVAPDGSMFVADFYNQAVIHNDTRGPDHNRNNAAVRPDRDHYFGRIWRIDHRQSKKLPVPNLAQADTTALVTALEHPNRAVRMTASRLLVEHKADTTPIKALLTNNNPETRLAALWTLYNLEPTAETAQPLLSDADPAVRRSALNICELDTARPLSAAAEKLIGDSDGQVRLAALRAIGSRAAVSDATAATLAAAWPTLEDDFQRSAAIGAMAINSPAAIDAVLAAADMNLVPLVTTLATIAGERNDAAAAARIVVLAAARPAAADPLKIQILDALGKSLRATPEMSPELTAALARLIASQAGGSALALVAKWDTGGLLKSEVATLTGRLQAQLADPAAADDVRIAAAASLIGLRQVNPDILPVLIKELAGEGSDSFRRGLIGMLGETDDVAVGTALAKAFPNLPPASQTLAFETLLKRSAWALALLDAVDAGQVNATVLGAANAARLRTYPDADVRKRAGVMLDKLMPLAAAKKEALAKLAPIVMQPGDAGKGKALFAAACATCHTFDGAGADIGPSLTGMGAHGQIELLGAIVDPNAEVDPSFLAWGFSAKDGRNYAGIIAAENRATITIKSLAGVQEIKKADLKNRVNTGLSLMPEGFENLGGEALRDIIAYLQSVGDTAFRTADLRDAFTATTSAGLYASQAATGDSFAFTKTGTVPVNGIPFSIVPPDKLPNNIIVLKGGANGSVAKSMPQKVTVPFRGFKADRLHFLGGVTGWGYKPGDDISDVMTITVHAVDGSSETIACRNGIEFADYFHRIDVPGSTYAKDLVRDHQLRTFSKQLSKVTAIDHLTLESPNRDAAPTIVAITAELAGANAAPLATIAEPAPKPTGFVAQFNDPVPQPPAARTAAGPRVLIVGGGSSHDFVKFFGGTDKETLKPIASWVDFTQNLNGIAPILANIDVLVLSANQPISPETQKALIDYANRGGGIIAHHPGTWYAWNDFPQWNKEIVGGGTRGHDRLGPYPVTVTDSTHPVTAGVTANFEITDELYNYIADPAATPIDVLVTATSPKTGKVFPQVFVVKHPKARIVGLTLGHDARAHDLSEYRTLLKNAVLWTAAGTPK